VKSGYARNFLLPTGAAMKASDSTESQATSMRRGRDLRDAASREAAEAQRTIIEAQSLSIAARASANGRLFGSVTEADVVNALRSATGISLDRHAIHMTEHLNEVGAATVSATLFDDVVATINVEITAK
jgi:large subunit ribosomal protein L9